jgi:hypothetical protein
MRLLFVPLLLTVLPVLLLLTVLPVLLLHMLLPLLLLVLLLLMVLLELYPLMRRRVQRHHTKLVQSSLLLHRVRRIKLQELLQECTRLVMLWKADRFLAPSPPLPTILPREHIAHSLVTLPPPVTLLLLVMVQLLQGNTNHRPLFILHHPVPM